MWDGGLPLLSACRNTLAAFNGMARKPPRAQHARESRTRFRTHLGSLDEGRAVRRFEGRLGGGRAGVAG